MSSVVYLTGHLDRHDLEDRLVNDIMNIEVHDRDPITLTDNVKRLEKFLAGGYLFNTALNDFVEEADVQGMDPALIETMPAMTPFDVDERMLMVSESGGSHGVGSRGEDVCPYTLIVISHRSGRRTSSMPAISSCMEWRRFR